MTRELDQRQVHRGRLNYLILFGFNYLISPETVLQSRSRRRILHTCFEVCVVGWAMT